MSIKYEFDTARPPIERKNYIFQRVSHRKLTDIYHSHDFFEIIIIDKGQCTKLINGNEVAADAGTIIFLRPDEFHSFTSQTEDIDIICLSVREREFFKVASIYGDEVKRLFSDDSILIIRDSDLNIRINALIGKTPSLCEEDYILMLSFIIRQLIRDSGQKIQNIPRELFSALEKMKDKENIRQGLTALLALSSYSHSQLGKLMHKHFGISPHEYIEKIRLDEAYRELSLTNIPIVEISENVGYSSFSHFNKIFKKKYGITPAVARKEHMKYTV